MKAVAAGLFSISILSISLVFTARSLALGNSYGSTMTSTPPAGSNTVAPDTPPTTATDSTTATGSGGSWIQSVIDASHRADVASERAYHSVARDVKDILLEAHSKIILRGNKATRGSDVHVTADNGIITLTGHVQSGQDAQRVRDIVASVYGVKAVNNALKYPQNSGAVMPSDVDSTAIAHPAYSDIAPAENARTH